MCITSHTVHILGEFDCAGMWRGHGNHGDCCHFWWSFELGYAIFTFRSKLQTCAYYFFCKVKVSTGNGLSEHDPSSVMWWLLDTLDCSDICHVCMSDSRCNHLQRCSRLDGRSRSERVTVDCAISIAGEEYWLGKVCPRSKNMAVAPRADGWQTVHGRTGLLIHQEKGHLV